MKKKKRKKTVQHRPLLLCYCCCCCILWGKQDVQAKTLNPWRQLSRQTKEKRYDWSPTAALCCKIDRESFPQWHTAFMLTYCRKPLHIVGACVSAALYTCKACRYLLFGTLTAIIDCLTSPGSCRWSGFNDVMQWVQWCHDVQWCHAVSFTVQDSACRLTQWHSVKLAAHSGCQSTLHLRPRLYLCYYYIIITLQNRTSNVSPAHLSPTLHPCWNSHTLTWTDKSLFDKDLESVFSFSDFFFFADCPKQAGAPHLVNKTSDDFSTWRWQADTKRQRPFSSIPWIHLPRSSWWSLSSGWKSHLCRWANLHWGEIAGCRTNWSQIKKKNKKRSLCDSQSCRNCRWSMLASVARNWLLFTIDEIYSLFLNSNNHRNNNNHSCSSTTLAKKNWDSDATQT